MGPPPQVSDGVGQQVHVSVGQVGRSPEAGPVELPGPGLETGSGSEGLRCGRGLRVYGDPGLRVYAVLGV